MGPPVGGPQVLDVNTCIALGGREQRMAEHLLNAANVGPVPEQMRGEGVTEKVGMDPGDAA